MKINEIKIKVPDHKGIFVVNDIDMVDDGFILASITSKTLSLIKIYEDKNTVDDDVQLFRDNNPTDVKSMEGDLINCFRMKNDVEKHNSNHWIIIVTN